jgi:DNA-binding transcriptional LysR family regulator
MDLRQMQVAVAVAETGGFTAAGRRLHLVQSAVSSTVRSLEHELGATLFERTTHRVTLTAAGEAFVDAARDALRAVAVARAAVDVVGTELHGTIAVGTMQGVWGNLHRALALLRQQHHHVRVQLRQAPEDDVRRDLHAGVLDLAIVALDSPHEKGLVTRVLSREPMVAVTAPVCSLPGPGPVSLLDLAELPFVDFTPGWAIRRSVDRAFRDVGIDRVATLEVNDVGTAADLVRQDLGVSILPESIAAGVAGVSIRSIVETIPAWTVLVVHRDGVLSPAAAALWHQI